MNTGNENEYLIANYSKGLYTAYYMEVGKYLADFCTLSIPHVTCGLSPFTATRNFWFRQATTTAKLVFGLPV
jgi:hypothetical protein